MTPLEFSMARMAATLRNAGKGFAVVGGFAVSAYTDPRMTRDSDLAVATDSDADAEQLLYALRENGYQVTTLIEHDEAGRLSTARLLHDDDLLVTDLLFASSGIENEIVAAAHEIDLTVEVRLPVACVGHLIAMKLLARDDRSRPTDAADLAALAGIATDADWRQAHQAVELIVARGFNREKDLVSSLQNLQELR